MHIWATIGIAIASIVFVTIFFMIVRTLLNSPKQLDTKVTAPVSIDKDLVACHLKEAIQIKTISMVEEYSDNFQPFVDYRDWLATTYPKLHSVSERTIIEDYSLIFRIAGSNPDLKGGCYLSHIDVVPATGADWEHDPFAGTLTDDGYIYGRGAQDMKSHMIALLEAVEFHLSNGKIFERDLYLCFGHDEEPGNSTIGASNIVKHLCGKGVQMEFVIDEGGTVLDGSMLGIPHTIALVGACEKGNGDLELVVNKSGGHASNPSRHTAVGILADAIHLIETHPMESQWTTMSEEMFKSLSPYCRPVFKFIFTNRDLLGPLIKWLLTVVTPMTNALVRTTFAPTMLWGADARNVIPHEARVNINFRTLTGETAEDVKIYLEKLLKKYVKKNQLEVKMLSYSNPSPEADVKCNAYKKLCRSITESFDNIVVAPYPFIAASDARFYNPLTNNVFRFGPFINSLDDQSRIHGINERLHVDQLERATQFFVRCLENTLSE